MPKTTLYHGDLLEVLDRLGLMQQHGTESAQFVARACGFDYEAPVEPDTKPEPKPKKGKAKKKTTPDEEKPPREALPFWALTMVTHRTVEQRQQQLQVPSYITDAPTSSNADWEYENTPLKGRPLLRWSRLWPFLQRVLSRSRLGRRPDMRRILRWVAQARPLSRLPREPRRVWNQDAHILVDRRSGLAPFWDDYDDALRRLQHLRGRLGLQIHYLIPKADGFFNAKTHQPFREAALPPSTAVLALADLGQLPSNPDSAHPWLRLGRRLRLRGLQPWALCPCPRDRWLPSMTRTWHIAAWDRHQHPPMHGTGLRAQPDQAASQDRRTQQLQVLLRLLSPAVRIERGLLRDIRLLLPASQADAGTEYDALQSADDGSEAGFTIETARLRELRAEFANPELVPLSLLLQVIRILQRHHRYCAPIAAVEEADGLLGFLPPSQLDALQSAGLLTAQTRQETALHWQKLAAGLMRGRFPGFAAAMREHAWKGIERLNNDTTDDLGKQIIWALQHSTTRRDIPSWVKPKNIRWLPPQALADTSTYDIRMGDMGINIGPIPQDRKGFLLSVIDSALPSVTIQLFHDSDIRTIERPWGEEAFLDSTTLQHTSRLIIETERSTLELSKVHRPPGFRMWYEREGLRASVRISGADYLFGWTLGGEELWPVLSGGPLHEEGRWKLLQPPPPWASTFEIDRFGLFATFHIRSVPFTLRWIPPGSFLMGSPEDDETAYADEKPQHEVRITRGFWMADTPVTQAQWRAVVEAAGAQPGLLKRLLGKKTLDPAPSHFQGPGELPVENVSWDDSGLFCELLGALLPGGGPGFRLPTEAQWEYACRAGKQGAYHDGSACTQPDGIDPALDQLGWFNQNSEGRTHAVKGKKANAWGLFDTHGNVWEWTRDTQCDYNSETMTDPTHDSSKDAHRVVRGGSWGLQARSCRAAFRSWIPPGNRWDDLGLRLSAGQEPAEPQEKERSDLPERRSRARRAGGSESA